MSNNSWDMRQRCATCRGWSCLQCAWAIAHDECRMDCPDCDDSRMRPEEPWGESPDAVSSDVEPPAQGALRKGRTQRARFRVARRHEPMTATVGASRGRDHLPAMTG